MKKFSDKILRVINEIPKGKVTTYKILSEKIGYKKAYRAAGNALNRNSNLIKIPCHRVIRSNGAVGGYKLGKKKKIAILKKEGIMINRQGRVKNFTKILYKFN